MTKRSGLALVAAGVIAGAPGLAGEVTGLTTFTPGTPARANEVNGNFDIVEGAVNDNHARLTAAEAELDAKQVRVTGTCEAGDAISAVAEDGGVTCVPALPDGTVSVSRHAFFAASYGAPENCVFLHLLSDGFFAGESGETGCIAMAPISLPHGATVSSLSCRVHDSYAGGAIDLSLQRDSLTTGSDAGAVFELPSSSDGGGQSLTDTTPNGGTAGIDNDAYAYYLLAIFGSGGTPFDDITFQLGLTGCSVAYTTAP